MRVFISRHIAEAGVFAAILREASVEVNGASLIRLAPLPFPPVPPSDWVFFSSRNAVQFFFENEENGLATNARMAAIGPATARTLAAFAPEVHFTGNGDPVATAAAFLPLAAGCKVLFPGARHSQQSVQKLLADQIDGVHWTVYENAPIDAPPDLRDYDALVFTSPMNAEAYFSRYPFKEGQLLVAIGTTTEAALRRFGATQVRVAAAPTEPGLAAAVLRSA